MRQSLIALGAATIALSLAATPALAAPASTVQYLDLDLGTPAGKAELDKRIGKAAAPLCRNEETTGTRLSHRSCEAQVRKLVLDEIAQRDSHTGKGG